MMLRTDQEIFDKIESLARIKAAFDCAHAGRGLYGNELTDQPEAVDFYGRVFNDRIEALEVLCEKKGFPFEQATLMLDVATQEVLRQITAPDAGDPPKPTLL